MSPDQVLVEVPGAAAHLELGEPGGQGGGEVRGLLERGGGQRRRRAGSPLSLRGVWP
ncbi:MAG: hypothetical protein R2749_04475 [Acidimicrobiales bacterium]